MKKKEKEGWHYLAVKKILARFRGITSNHHGDFYCLNFLYSIATKCTIRSHKNLCKNSYFYGTVLSNQKANILQFNQYIKSGKMLYIIYTHIELLIEKIDNCKNNPEKSSATKI